MPFSSPKRLVVPALTAAALLVIALLSSQPALAQPGTVDPGFEAAADSVAWVYATALQPDGKILVGGLFTSFGGVPRRNIARLHPDGTVDSDFNPGANGGVLGLVVQDDGKILLAGSFTSIAGIPRNFLARLNADGTLDTGFDPNPNATVRGMALQPDGKILVVGDFTVLGPWGGGHIARLLGDGTRDPSFGGWAEGGTVRTVAVQSDGKVIVGGDFMRVSYEFQERLARLNPNGSYDFTWNAAANGTVEVVTVQADGKILVSGSFNLIAPHAHWHIGRTRNGTARINEDGSLDTSWLQHVLYPRVHTIAFQTNGKILLAGTFMGDGGVERHRIARLNPDVTLDEFDPNADFTVFGASIQADGRVLVGGAFSVVGGVSRQAIARLSNDAATQSLTVPSASRVEWLRGGSSPEAQYVTFELSTDSGLTFSLLGFGARISGGFELTGLSLPPSGHIRARARVTGGHANASSGLVETVAAFGTVPPEIVVSGNGLNIEDGDATPSLVDHTDLGPMNVAGASVVRTFKITNRGAASLTLGTVTVSGAQASDFTVTAQPVSPVPANGSTTFQVTFDPAAIGLRSAILSFTNNDANESPFDFLVQGAGFVSTNANLASLETSLGPLTPGFTPNQTAYGVAVGFNVSSLTVTAAREDPHASIQVRINGGAYQSLASGSTSGAFGLNVGPNPVDVLVTAQDLVTTRTYTITVTRAASAPGDVDPGFDPGPNADVTSIALQPDGKIVVGGGFSSLGGVSRNRIARLDPDGGLDTFNPDANGAVNSVAVQRDGKILIAGFFGSVGGVARNRLARVNADGTLDPGFDPAPSSSVYSVAVQPDGKILIGGLFSSVGGVPRGRIARLHVDGTPDPSFNPNPNNLVSVLALQGDGRILIGGGFTSIGGVPRGRIARLNLDGTLDPSFNPAANADVNAMALQPDGKIVIGGSFSEVGGAPRGYIARLNDDGSLDPTFDPGSDQPVNGVVMQADGKVLLFGDFTTISGVARNRVARLNPNGTLDPTFDPNVDGQVSGGALQSDGRVILGGTFTAVGGIARVHLARIDNDAASESLTVPDATRVQWMRGGASPETHQVTFELSTDAGVSWGELGPGTRINGGFDLSSLSLPASGEVRARARVASGQRGSSQGLVEAAAVINLPAEVAVIGGSFDIADGDGAPTTADGTHFGTIGVASGSGASTFTITNSGIGFLTLGAITLTGAAASDFTVTQQPVSPVPPGGSTTFEVAFDPSAAGARAATLSFVTNDADENPFDFAIHGVGGSESIDQNFDPGADHFVWSSAVQPDRKVVLVGQFGSLGGVARGRMARVHSDGTLDEDFDPNLNGQPQAVIVQPDGKILVAGQFTVIAGAARDRVARLNADGTLDAAFTAGANGIVQGAAAQPDGKTILVGRFTAINGIARNRVARLNEDGTLDDEFNPNANGIVYGVAVQPNRQILLVGAFTATGGVTRNRIARVNSDGTLDTAFNPSAGRDILCVALQANGQILLGGQVGNIGGVARTGMARLNPDGTLDTGFNPSPNNVVWSLAVQADGRIPLSGDFITIGGIARNRVARLNQDGTADPSFDPNANGAAYGVTSQADGAIVVTGAFTTLGGWPRSRIARVPGGAATETLSVSGASRVEWIRGGSSPEALGVTFELSTDGGTSYTSLGAGVRIGGGFELTGLNLPGSGQIRARAVVGGGGFGGVTGLVEAVTPFSGLPSPEIVVSGNNVVIVNGASAPNSADHTDFGSAVVATGSVVRTFAIDNDGTALLAVGSVGTGGADASDFTVVTQPSASVAPGDRTTFEVAFHPSALGTRVATLGFANNDSDEGLFSIAIQGQGVTGCPAIAMTPPPNGIEGTAYSTTLAAAGGIGPYTYSITTGPLPAGLTLSGATISGTPSTPGTFVLEITATDTATACTGALTSALVVGSPIAAGDLVIREFRVRGPAAATGESDEYVVIHNRRTTPLTVAALDGSTGFAVVASDGSILFTIPSGTVIRPRGHFLGVNTTGFSLGVAHDASWSADIADGSGLALFKTVNPANFGSGARLDAVGFGPGLAPYFEGVTLTSPGPAAGEYAWVRKAPSGIPQDTNSNAVDFVLVAPDAALYGSVRSTLGSPTPVGSDTWDSYTAMSRILIEPTVGVNATPNRIRTGSGNSGTLEVRVRVMNNSTESVSSLRLRVLELTTLHSPGYSTPSQADLRPVNGPDVTIPATTIGVMNLEGLTLDTPPAQSLGGGWNSTLSIPLSTALLPGGTVDFNLVFNIHRSGSYRYWITYEAGQ